MKKMMKFFGIIAVAAMSLTACQNEFDEQVNVNGGETVVIDITANTPATRSAFGDKDGNAYPSTWSGTELVGFIANPVDGTHETITDVENTTDGSTATFTGVELANVGTSGYILAVSPYNTGNYDLGGFSGISTSFNNFYISIPKKQTPLAKSVDESAHLLFAKYEYNSTPANVVMNFQHIGAYGKMTIKNFDGEIAGITLTATQNIVGRGYCKYDGTVSFNNDHASATLTLNTSKITHDPSNTEGVWFACFPVGTLTGDLKIVITDSEGATYTKELATAGRLAFNAGQVSAFSVDMSKDVTVDAPAAGEQTATITFDDKAKRTSYSTSQQVWEENGIIVTNNKASSTSNVGDYAEPARFYKSSELIVEAPGNITEIVFDCNSGNYATAMGVGTVSNDKVTVTLDGTETSYTCTMGSGQVRMDAITVTYVEANPNLKEQNIVWSTGNQTIVYGFEDEFEVPELKGAITTVTYESSNTDVVTVSAEGVVALVEGAEGTAIIKATAVATDEYKKATASVTITVEKASVTDVADLTWDADNQDAKTITLTGNHLDKVADYITINKPENFTVVKSGFTLTITPNQINETEEAIENTLEIRIVNGETTIGKGCNVTLTQKGVVSGGEGGATTVDMTITAKTGTMNGTASISWTSGDVTVTNHKGSTAIRTSDSDHYRAYQNSTLTFTAANGKKFTQIVITCTNGSYANAMKDSLGNSATVSGSIVTWTGSATEVSATMTAQSRFKQVVATIE